MQKLKNTLNWLNENLLYILSVFLLIFIPLFPKIPIFDILPGYIVRVRAEDFLIIFTGFVFLRDVLKKKFNLFNSYFFIVVFYLASGLLSIALGVLLTKSIPPELLHVGKSGLHLFRYAEYFTIFFYLYSSIKKEEQLKNIFNILSVGILFIVFYGFGQIYWQFPVYSTMNREFSKGEAVYLQDNAKPHSTFGGHYDLAAYLLLMLPIFFSILLSKFKKSGMTKMDFLQIAYFVIVQISGLWMLVASGSKTALFAYLFSIFVIIIYKLYQIGSLKKQLKYGFLAVLSISIVFLFIFRFFGQETQKLLFGLAKNNEYTLKIASKLIDVEQLETDKNALNKPTDLYGEGHEIKKMASVSAKGEVTYYYVKQESTWSANALKYGISMGIRLDTLWPQAMRGAINNPTVGSGYATLSRTQEGQFTEADSTDNNYLRVIGETGILGFISFFGFVFLVVYYSFKYADLNQIILGFFAGTLGLLIDAIYIDVFASSKVAFSFWALSGITFKLLEIKNKIDDKIILSNFSNHFKKYNVLYFATLFAIFILHSNPLRAHSTMKEFAFTKWGVETITKATCYAKVGKLELCNLNDFSMVMESKSSIYSALLAIFHKIYNSPTSFYFLNISLVMMVIIFNFFILKNKNIWGYILALSFLFFVNYINQPLPDYILILYFLLFSCICLIYQKINYKFLNIFTAVIICVFYLINLSIIKDNYYYSQKVLNFWVVDRANDYFNTTYIMDNQKPAKLISELNPYFINLYSNRNYLPMPFSIEQEYVKNADQVFDKNLTLSNIEKLDETELINFYKEQINTQELYLSEIGKNANLQNYKKNFDLKYVDIDCNELCHILNLKPISQLASPIPDTINKLSLVPNELPDDFEFVVISNEFLDLDENDEVTPEQKANRNMLYAQNLNEKLSKLLEKELNTRFVIFTGDTTLKPENTHKEEFELYFANLLKLPLLYNAGNYVNQPEKIYDSKIQTFFNSSTYIILLDIKEKDYFGTDDKLKIYNSFLEIEKLANIKNVVIVMHDLDPNQGSKHQKLIEKISERAKNINGLKINIITAQDIKNPVVIDNISFYSNSGQNYNLAKCTIIDEKLKCVQN